ncbi:MAG: ABC-2 type transport system permease protein [Flavobacteriales bacterium]|jgi:ABC-2 type transport system permease protein
MSKIGLIIKREYSTRVTKKSFIIMTFLAPLIFAAVIFGGVWFILNDTTHHDVLVVDQNGILTRYSEGTGHLESRFANTFKDSENLVYHFTKDDISDEVFKESVYTLKIVIDDAQLNSGSGTPLTYKKIPSLTVKETIKYEIENAIEQFRVQDNLKLDWATYKSMKVSVSFVEMDVEQGGRESLDQYKAVVGFGFSVMIYFFIFLYGVQVMRGVIEEKTNRIVEVIISSVKPFQLMMGKIVGIGLVGLTQFLMWVVLCSIVMFIGSFIMLGDLSDPALLVDAGAVISTSELSDTQVMIANNDFAVALLSINWPLLISLFIFFFIGGFLLYGAMFAAIGSAVDAETDTQQFMLPVSLPLIFGFIVAEMLVQNPDSSLGVIFELVPFTSPIVMMIRSAMGFSGIEWLVLFSSMAILILTFLLFVWIAGRIYRIGILMYGKKASYKEIWKWIIAKQ